MICTLLSLHKIPVGHKRQRRCNTHVCIRHKIKIVLNRNYFFLTHYLYQSISTAGRMKPNRNIQNTVDFQWLKIATAAVSAFSVRLPDSQKTWWRTTYLYSTNIIPGNITRTSLLPRYKNIKCNVILMLTSLTCEWPLLHKVPLLCLHNSINLNRKNNDKITTVSCRLNWLYGLNRRLNNPWLKHRIRSAEMVASKLLCNTKLLKYCNLSSPHLMLLLLP